MAQWSLESLEISGGFLADVHLRFPQGLICVIGPRGSGKSTLAEAIRLGVGGLPSGAAKPRLDFIKANLSGTVLTLTTAPGTERGQFIIRRTYGQSAVMTAGDGRPVKAVDLDRGTFLPLDAYTSLDVEAIADESLGEKRRSLLDELCASEMQRIHLQLADQKRGLEANADAVVSARRRIADLTEQMEEIGDAGGRLAALPPVNNREGSPEFQAASRQRQMNEREGDAMRLALETVGRLRSDLANAVAGAKSRLSSPRVVPASLNAGILAQADKTLSETWPLVDGGISAADAALAAASEQLGVTREQLKQAHAGQEAAYLRLQQQNQEVVQAVEARTAAERDMAALEALAHQKRDAATELNRLLEERKTLKADYLLTRDRIAELREGVAAKLQRESGAKVRVRVLRNADAMDYQAQLFNALHGSGLKNQDEIIRTLSRIRPEDLAQVIHEDDLAEMDAQTSFGKERGRKILDALRRNLNALALEILPIEDRVCIELNVAASGPESFRDAAELSRGQKCTALLPILLARRDSPLIIDQPEDNLDNHFIYETVVESILRLKARRQMLFITHNANIPVLGHADLVVVMNSDGRRGYVEKAGSVDECRKEIIDLLEGGEEAFELRRKRYVS